MKGLKQMVAEATEAINNQTEQAGGPEPVTVSGEAIYALAEKLREWSGWSNARLVIDDPRNHGAPSPFAACNHLTRTFVANADRLVLNPNRVLLTVTPFRLRQEAVLTGSLLHEAGHARHSHWMPRTEAEAEAKPLLHTDGTEPTEQVIKLARLMEEARVEGLMARDADKIGAATLDWTMRASAAELVPVTTMSTDPNQQVMDLITSWALRAGRQYALAHWTDHRMRGWVGDFTSLLHTTIVAHLTERAERGAEVDDPTVDANRIVKGLTMMTHVEDDTGPTMIDYARLVLEMLFPETDDEDGAPQPMPGEGCQSDETEQGEGDQPEQESEGEGKGDQPESGEGDQPESEGEGKGDQPEQESEGEGEGEPEQPEQGEPESEESEGEQPEQEGDSGATGSTEGEQPEQSELAKALADMEAAAKDQTEEEVDEDATDAEDEAAKGKGAGGGSGGGSHGGWRDPTKDEREVQKGAERFLRNMIDASETSTISLTDTPSATVDGAALAAWKAGGQHTDPNFFVRTRREVQPSPPVRIAILVDVSASMDELATPSAILSWSLAAAALDLRNFAGRGAQVESCLIHWGSSARVIQPVGEVLPGIRQHACDEGTYAMHSALALVEEQMPGFFDGGERPANRLLVQFTDWELFGRAHAAPWIERALASGVNMLTVAPRDYKPRDSDLAAILQQCKVQRGRSSLMKYNPLFPSQVWDTAAEMLG